MTPTLSPAPLAGHAYLVRAPGERYCSPPSGPAEGPLRGEWHRAETWPPSAAETWEAASLWPTGAARVLWAWLLSTAGHGRPAAPSSTEDGALIERALAAGAAASREGLAARLAVATGRPMPGVRKALWRAARGGYALPAGMRVALEGWAGAEPAQST